MSISRLDLYAAAGLYAAVEQAKSACVVIDERTPEALARGAWQYADAMEAERARRLADKRNRHPDPYLDACSIPPEATEA